MVADQNGDRDAGYEVRRANSPERASPEIRLEESAARLGYRHQLLNLLVERMALGEDLIDDAEG